MFKKAISWFLVLATLCAGFAIPAFSNAGGYSSVTEAEYDFQYTGSDGKVGYANFGSQSHPDNGYDISLGLAGDNQTVTLLRDVDYSATDVLTQRNITIEGNGHTLRNFKFRCANQRKNLVFRNVNFECENVSVFFMQVEATDACTFENCTFNLKSQSLSEGFFNVNGAITMNNCTLTLTLKNPGGSNYQKYGFLLKAADAALTLNDTVVTGYDSAADKTVLDVIRIGSVANAKLTLNENTVLSSTRKQCVQVNGGATNPTINDLRTTWDGNTTDTSWFDASNVQDSYEIDTAAKLAGLAKLCKDKNTVDFPSNGRESLVTFYITKDIDLGGYTWTPIGESYTARFSGNIIGKKNGVEGAAVTISGLKVDVPGTDTNLYGNKGFIGTTNNGVKVANLIFLNSVVSMGANTCGTVIGYACNSATLSNIKVLNGKVTAGDCENIGGLVGYASGTLTMTDCEFNGTVQSNATQDGSVNKTGGLLGFLHAKDGVKVNLTNCTVRTFVAADDAGTNNAARLYGSASDATKITDTNCHLVALQAPTSEQFKNNGTSLRLPTGNVATVKNSGLRFTTVVDKAWYNAFVNGTAGVTVKTGTLVVKNAEYTTVGALTFEKLASYGEGYLNIENNGWYNGTDADDFYFYYGNVVNFAADAVGVELAGVGYMTVTIEGVGTFTFYGQVQTGSVKGLAEGRNLDGNDYDEAQKEVLRFFRAGAN